MENFLLQLSGVAAGRSRQGGGVCPQLGGPAMDLMAFDLKVGLNGRDIQMGLATAYLRVLSDEDRRSKDIMAA